MIYTLKEPTRSLMVPWGYMPQTLGYREIGVDDMDSWNRELFQDLKMLVPDLVALRPIVRGAISVAVYAVSRHMLEEVKS